MFVLFSYHSNISSSNERNDSTLKKKGAKSKGYLAKNITYADYADDLVLLANTLALVESLLHSLKQAAKGIGFCINSDKIEFMCFNQDSPDFSLNSKPLKFVD